MTNPPYLLFYPDANGDDIPDGDPEVLLEGFGLEDSHSVINSLRFGPDGWLYGAQGSTVSGNVKRTRHKGRADPDNGPADLAISPRTKTLRSVCRRRGQYVRRGDGRARGNLFGPQRWRYAWFHYVQGGYYRKGFGKHGPVKSYAFGYFDNIKHASVPRFTHNFIIYEEGVLPEEYRGRLFGIEPLQGQVVMTDIRPYQSSFETEDILAL